MRCEYLCMDKKLENENSSSQEIIDLNSEIEILKEDISQIVKENEIKVNTLAKVHLVEIEDIKKQSNVYVRCRVLPRCARSARRSSRPRRPPSLRSRRSSSQSATVGWYKRTDTLKQQSFLSRRDIRTLLSLMRVRYINICTRRQ